MKSVIKLLALVCIFLNQLPTHAQEYLNDHHECHLSEQNSNQRMTGDLSTNGDFFTPRGDLRILVIYVDWDFPGYNATDYPMSASQWPFGQEFPTNHVDETTGELLYSHNNITDFAPLGSPGPTDNSNLSEFFYQMSNGQFRVYFETLRDPNTGNAVSVKVDPAPLTPGFSEFQIRPEVYKIIRQQYPQDWARFDTRNNHPDYNSDESTTFDCLQSFNPCGDNQIDYVAIFYRNNRGWATPVLTNPGNGVSGVYSGVLQEDDPLTIENEEYVTRQGHLIYNNFSFNGVLKALVHEAAHGYWSAPHINGANTVHGRYFYMSAGWDQMNYAARNSLSNAWERWYLGWQEITYDLNENSGTTQISGLKDFASTGESIRLKLPHTDDQFIWLENHLDENNVFYKRYPTFQLDGDGNEIPQQKTGLYGFVERLEEDRFDVEDWPLDIDRKNGIKLINGKGNHDYDFDGFHTRSYLFNDPNNLALRVNYVEPNPYGGHHEASYFRADYRDVNNNPTPDGTIEYITGEFGGSGVQEGSFITEVDDEIVWGSRAPNIALKDNKKISAFTNPPLTNFQEISTSLNTLSPIVLHSLSITPTTNSDGTIDFTIDYNDGTIEQDFRMTGNVYLPNNEVIILKLGRELLLNRTGTPTRITADGNGSFFDPTVFIADDGGQLLLESHSQIILDEASTMIFEGGSTLDMQFDSKIYIRNGSLLCIKEGANIQLHPNARIIVQDGTLNIHPSIDISANVVFENNTLPNPQVVNFNAYCSVNSPEHIHSLNGTAVADPFNCGIVNEVVVSNTYEVKLTSEEFIFINSTFEVEEGGVFEAEILEYANDCDIDFFFGTNGQPFTGGTTQTENHKEQHEDTFSITAVPNPSNGEFRVTLDSTFELIVYTLYDFGGNPILSGSESQTDTFVISKNELPEGIYLLKMRFGKEVSTIKIIINK